MIKYEEIVAFEIIETAKDLFKISKNIKIDWDSNAIEYLNLKKYKV